jgi:hypothetical protein
VSTKRGLLLAKMDPPSTGEKAWNKYYNDVHVADRVAIPGFLSARRFRLVEGIPRLYAIPGDSKYLAIYDLTGLRVLKEEGYRKVWEKDHAKPADSWETQIFKLPRFARGIYEQVFPEQDDYTVPDCSYVLVVGHEVPRGKTAEFNAWYNTEHIPYLLKVPGVLAIRRFKMAAREYPPMTDRGGFLSTYVTIWDVADKAAFDSDEFRNSAATPWSQWVRSWYTRKICALYERVYPDR